MFKAREVTEDDLEARKTMEESLFHVGMVIELALKMGRMWLNREKGLATCIGRELDVLLG